MNRRELFKNVTGGLAAAGVTAATVEALEPPDKPGDAVVVLKCDQYLSSQQRVRILETWKAIVEGTAWDRTPVVVLDGGLTVEVYRR